MIHAGSPVELTERAGELREAFDRSFAEPATAAPTALEELLAIRVAGNPYALCMNEIAGLYLDQPVTVLPGRDSALFGLVGLRGSLVAVYDLAALLGETEQSGHRWIALAVGVDAVAFAFHSVDGHLRVPARSSVAAAPTTDEHPHAPEAVAVADIAYTIISVPDLLSTLRPAESDKPNAGRERP